MCPLYYTFSRYGTWLGLLAAAGCVDAYMPDVINAPNSYLVVDGFINGNGVTRIKLSRTENIAATTAPAVEKGASLFIIDNTGGRYILAEKANGSYQSDSLQLNPSRQYQLRITARGGVTYESALVPLKITPALNKLAWQLTGDQVDIQVSTQDNTQQSRFYHWQFVETWEFNAAYLSKLEYFPNKNPYRQRIGRRVTPIYTCWRTERPTTIKQANTTQLSQDALTDFTVLSIANRAERLKIRYSVLVSQYAQTAEEFAYYELLRKNTEAVGTVNDPLPTQLTGNVHRVDNASEPVLGFVSAHTMQYRRLFIDRAKLPFPPNWAFDTPYTSCISLDSMQTDAFGKDPNYIPIDKISKGWLGSTRACVDCRVRGTNTKPSFW
jgi:hypothetical protein